MNVYFPHNWLLHMRVYYIAWLACLRARVLCVFGCLRAHVLGVFTCLACLRAYVLGVLSCVRACLLWWNVLFSYVLGVLFCLICFTFQYLNLKIMTAKKLCFVKLNIFLIYILIAPKAISIFYNLYIHLLH